MITDKQIEKFQQIYKEIFGVEITKEEALIEAPKLIQLIRIIYQPTNQTQKSTQQG